MWLAQSKVVRISSDAQRLIKTAELLISPMVLLELEYVFEAGRLKTPSRDVQLKLESETTIKVCELPFATVARVAAGESWTRDPFDRIIVAQAKAHGFAFLISSDQQIAKHYPRTIW